MAGQLLRLLLSLAATARAYDPIPYPSCTIEEYLDISSLTCNSCPTGQRPDDSGLSCQCKGGKLQASSTTAGVWECVSCASLSPPEAPTRDGLACLPCLSSSGALQELSVLINNATGATSTGLQFGDTLGLNAATGECACAENLALVERDGLGGLLPAKTCTPCPASSVPRSLEAGVWQCEACPAEHMEAVEVTGLSASAGSEVVCKCQSGYLSRNHPSGWWGRDTSCLEQACACT